MLIIADDCNNQDDDDIEEYFENDGESYNSTNITSSFTPGDCVRVKGRARGDATVLSSLLGKGSKYPGRIKVGYDKNGCTYHVSPDQLVLIIGDDRNNQDDVEEDEDFENDGESYNSTDIVTTNFAPLRETGYMLKVMVMQLCYRTCWEKVQNTQEESKLDSTMVVDTYHVSPDQLMLIITDDRNNRKDIAMTVY